MSLTIPQVAARSAGREVPLKERGYFLILLDYKAIFRSRTKVLKSLSERPMCGKALAVEALLLKHAQHLFPGRAERAPGNRY
jgi:hypothetical protein